MDITDPKPGNSYKEGARQTELTQAKETLNSEKLICGHINHHNISS